MYKMSIFQKQKKWIFINCLHKIPQQLQVIPVKTEDVF